MKNTKLPIRETAVFAMLGAIMFVTKMAMEWAPNIHPLGLLVMAYTLVFRAKALIPLYIYVFLDGLIHGFGLWWIPYLYIWTILWGITMLLPKKIHPFFYALISGAFGLAFGTLYAPFQALAFGLSAKSTLAWIVAGLPFDALHAAGNFATGFLIVPLSKLLEKLWNSITAGRSPR